MINFSQQQFVKTLANIGFEVEDLSTDAVDAQNARVLTEQGTFEIVVRNKWVVFHKPNGTTKDYWGSTAQILAYVRQTLKANGGIVEAPEADVEWVSEENVRRIVAEATEAYPGLVRKDLDAINEGWDAFKYPESGYLYQHCLNVLESGMPTSWPKSGESYDEALDWLADATYSTLCPEEEEEDGGTPKFADLTTGQLDYIENAGIGDLFVTPEQVVRITDELRLHDLGPEEATATRNAVVRHLADLATEARETGDWDAFERYHDNMSGICAVIDRRLMA